jgi:SAM-dependent methyltransferase
MLTRPNVAVEIAPDTPAELACYGCGHSPLKFRFAIPLIDGPFREDREPKTRTLYECAACGQLSGDLYDPSQYSGYYAALTHEYHDSHDYDQARYRQILDQIPERPGMKALDIGCGVGTFLSMLPPDTMRFGIEPSTTAAACARQKGVNIIQYGDLSRPELRNTFDLVTAIDVVEHMAKLQDFRRHLTTALRPGGIAIILTGNSQSKPARLLGRYWSYLNFAEHVTIFCPSSMRAWLKPSFSGIELLSTSHHPCTFREAIVLVRIWLLFPVKWLLRKLFRRAFDMYTVLSLPGDHMLVRAIRN